MKTIKILFICSFVFIFSFTVEAQFLNKLKNKIVEKTEDVIINKTADKAAEQTSEAMEKILNPNLDGLFNIGGGKMVDINELPAEYNFNYLYKIKMTTGEGDIEMDYFFNKDESYFGARSQLSPDMIMVFDVDKNLFVIKSGERIIAREIEIDVKSEVDEEADIYNDYIFKELPNKEFLGIICSGYEMENDENRFIVYIAPDVGVGFGSGNGGKIVNMPKEMQEFSKRHEKGLMMYMEMNNKLDVKKNDKSSTSMECIEFEKSDSTIKIR
jgi:hypothetical protein